MTEGYGTDSDTGSRPAEGRAAVRTNLLIRPAKLVTAAGEYLCVLRDVSTTGLKLRTFHPLPSPVVAQLELGNGDRYPIERVWQQADHAGFRFATPVPIEYLVKEDSQYPKRPVRLRISRSAVIVAGHRPSSVAVVDLSQQGARVEGAGDLARDQQVRLEIDGIRPIVAKVRWRRGTAAGLVFEQTFRLDEFARLAFTLQPVDTVSEIAAADAALFSRYARPAAAGPRCSYAG